ncbi:MAG: [FeFe] hydrogenase H-cluster maturation GTPase HydF [Clostridiaceae bacterium]|nr:[FeFe] hydrogenase H-cluster maturation GTPase HydF [Clostridiaceae bacterium]
MSLNDTASAERVHIGFFGVRNAGKSSLVNRITNQEMSVVSDVKGTTTDSVRKAMELLPVGPVVIIDTPGIDDEGELGEKRVKSAKKTLDMCDVAVLVTENETLNEAENGLVAIFREREIPYLVAVNKADLKKDFDKSKLYVSALTGEGIEALKEKIAEKANLKKKEVRLVADFISKGDTVILVIPIDESAPKGRIILPQQQALRDILDAHARALVCQPEELEKTLDLLRKPPKLVITDSQVFAKVMKIVPESVKLTSFSIILARYKGFLNAALEGAEKLDSLSDGAKILVCEGCTHHRQCEDIGTVKLPRWLKEYTKKDLNFEFTSGHGYPDNLGDYDLVLHCGGCMLGDAEMKSRVDAAKAAGVAFTNYGTVIAKLNGILERSTEIL